MILCAVFVLCTASVRVYATIICVLYSRSFHHSGGTFPGRRDTGQQNNRRQQRSCGTNGHLLRFQSVQKRRPLRRQLSRGSRILHLLLSAQFPRSRFYCVIKQNSSYLIIYIWSIYKAEKGKKQQNREKMNNEKCEKKNRRVETVR